MDKSLPDSIGIAPSAQDDAADRRRRIMAIVGSSSGNLVEWYDFYCYAFFALYFAPAFFPQGDRTSQLLQTAGIFAVGFFMRPIGGWLFGRIADRLGRRTSMVISVLMMCAGSLAIGLLPTYATVGAAAPILLLLARMVQGISVGGEYGTSATYMSEVAVKGKRGFYASFQYVTLIGGQLLASLVLVSLQAMLTEADLRAWGWRIPFFIGALAAVVALYLRRSLAETMDKNADREQAGTFKELGKHWRAFCVVLAYTAGGSLSFYTFTTYMQKYLVNTAHMEKTTASQVMTSVLLVYMLIQPIFGALSDRIGRKANMLLYSGLGTLMVVPLMTLLGGNKDPYLAFALITLGLTVISFYTGISGIVKAELFPTNVRALGVGLSYALANATFGGTAEFAALWFKENGIEASFFWYVTAMLAIAFVASIIMPNPKRHGYLDGDGTVEEALGAKPRLAHA
ncbi:MFS family transporter [Methylobacterium oxalidis]|uniref:Alpha-ketoglutarate permease n=1 Tax=Methylobacterium oxalidis TaxID=944322 RepID=A0A512IWN4_9HYPH|nr:MFS family transporter [Methylobacterium oxalidis]GEP02105.1 dicarboxylic acid transporter PcaT [Methylobacterium oxalidis]GJE35660.1 Alpha-ketoglutarate permease [Methylobacterium oxalidis]GLS62050.1 dicarboxylic acid transporter PcaT [Methylobacterium oxalidis]